MSPSTEYLDMDKGDSASDKRRGYFVTHRCLAAGVVLVIAALVVVGVSTRYLSNPKAETTDTSDQKSVTDKPSPERPKNVRLPRSLEPVHYDVQIEPQLFGNFTFLGSVAVTVRCLEDTDSVTLHSKDLNVSDVFLGDAPADKVEEVKTLQFLVVHSKEKLVKGRNYTLKMKFQGLLNDDLAGLYRSSYVDASGNKKWLAATQFQATDARRAFPCFDEPAMKATFSLRVVRPDNLTSISNMPIQKTEQRDDGLKIDVFETTMRMSTYLLALVVSDFQFRGNDKFRVWARPEAVSSVEYSLSIGPKILDFYEQYFSEKYPLPKTDMIALPDFNAGAMENWGLVTFRETSLLLDRGVSSTGNKQRVAVVVSHELGHQWFGNLVTMEWWDDLWLNEGFATYVEYLGVDFVENTWGMLDQFVPTELQSVMELDALKTSHPVSVPVYNPEEINENFDKISYAKGASIIRMMNFFLTEDVFRKGVTNYLQKRKFANARQDDLWEELTEAQGQKDNRIDVKKVMDSWTLQTGFPLVTVNRSEDGRSAIFTQRRFLVDGSLENNTKTLWKIPITYTSAQSPDWNTTTPKFWLNEESATETNLPPSSVWFIVNVREVGYYKVNYDERSWRLLVRQLTTGHTDIDVINRAQLIDDLLDLSRADIVDYTLALDATEYLIHEQSYLPWDAALSNLAYVSHMLATTDAYGLWTKYLLKLTKPNYNKLGWDEVEGESVLITYLRQSMLSLACNHDEENCVTRAVNMVKDWKNSGENSSKVPPNFRSFVYCTAVKHGGNDVWEFLWKMYNITSIASEKSKILNSLGCTREPWIISRFLQNVINPDGGVRRQDGTHVLSAVASTDTGRSFAFNFLLENWAAIHKAYVGGAFALPSLFSSAARSINTPYKLKQLQDFYEDNKATVAAVERTYRQTVEKAQSNIRWMDKNLKKIKNWLVERIK